MPRAYAPVAAVLMLAVTVTVAASVVVFLPSLSVDPPPQRGVEASATADGRVELTLLSGPDIDAANLAVRVEVEGEPLRHQPPVPFFSARGFYSGPTGAFNSAANSSWRVGETPTFHVAGTNRPTLDAGDDLRVELRVRGTLVGVAETVVERRTEEQEPKQNQAAAFSPRPGFEPPSRWRADSPASPASRGVRRPRSQPPGTSGRPPPRRRTT